MSFTNAACNEVVRRCRENNHADLLAFPHFIGTIDSFIWRYLARPLIEQGRYRQRIDTWDRINAIVTVQGKREHKIRLSEFHFHRDLTN